MKRTTIITVLTLGMLTGSFAFAQSGTSSNQPGSEYPSQYKEGSTQGKEQTTYQQQDSSSQALNPDPAKAEKERMRKAQQQKAQGHN